MEDSLAEDSLAEDSLANKLKEDFVNLVFSGIAIQELKKKFTEKDIINRFTYGYRVCHGLQP